jgi:hypothetical protein
MFFVNTLRRYNNVKLICIKYQDLHDVILLSLICGAIS